MRPTKSRTIPIIVLLTGCGLEASATTWGEPEAKPDPIHDGAKCMVQEPMSSGSYIYHWPSKYDQVFWPLTDPHGIWFCPNSGFTAFLGDFELTAEERAALAAQLPHIYKKESRKRPKLRPLLELLEENYSRRDKDRTFQIQLVRALAYYHDAELEDHAEAMKYRRKALAMIEEALRTELPEAEKLEYLFVAAAYYRELDEAEKATRKLQELNAAMSTLSDEGLEGYAEYLSALKEDLDRIEPGGPLAPPPRTF